MSLIPYYPQEGREIVLRHRNAIVVRDSISHRLEIRGLTECPTCRRPLPRSGSQGNPFEAPAESNHESYVDPDYFRMLQTGTQESTAHRDPPSTLPRSFKPALAGSASARPSTPESLTGSQQGDEYGKSLNENYENDTEFLSSAPGVSQGAGNRIRRQAFSPGYFKTFFKEQKVLGKGGKGVVLLVRHEIDNCDLGYFACKRVPVGDDHAWLEKVLVEVGLLNKLSHPNLVSYRHVWLESARLTRFGPSVACAFILQQYCNGGDLHQYIIGSAPKEATKEELKAQMRRRSRGQAETPKNLFPGSRQLSFDEIYSLFKDITSGVAYLHSNNYIHRDLKPSNCLLHREGGKLRCLISDFGEVQPENVIRKSTGSTGTISYCAPEVVKMDAAGRYGNFTTKSDIFSLGMILYFMCFGTLPYRSANAIQEELEDFDELRAEISDWQGLQDERRERPDLPSRLYTLLKRLLSLNPAERPSASEILGAMRGENVSEGLGRVEQPPPHGSFGLHGSRIQNLDSPARSGTPTPEPSNHLTLPRAAGRDVNGTSSGSLAHGQPALRGNDGTIQNRHQTMSSPLSSQPLVVAENRANYAASVMSEPSATDEYDGRTERDHHDRSPPLLMAPPRTRFDELRHRAGLALLHVFSLVGLEGDILNHLLRMALFVAKLISLARPCWPYMVKIEVAVPLIVIAALDLRVPEPATSALARRNRLGEIEFGPSRARGLGWSFVLLGLHALALWVAGRRRALCITPHQEDWGTW